MLLVSIRQVSPDPVQHREERLYEFIQWDQMTVDSHLFRLLHSIHLSVRVR